MYRKSKRKSAMYDIVEEYTESGLNRISYYHHDGTPHKTVCYYPADDMGISYIWREEFYKNKTLTEVREYKREGHYEK